MGIGTPETPGRRTWGRQRQEETQPANRVTISLKEDSQTEVWSVTKDLLPR